MRPFAPALVLAPLLACGDKAGSDDTATTTPADDTGEVVDSARFDEVRAAIEAALPGNNATGVSVAIYEDGEITFAEGFGTAVPDEDVPVTPTMLFQIGSSTKMQTAAALMQKVDGGQVALDDTVNDVLPDLEMTVTPGLLDDTTMSHLVTHQGGFYDYLDWAQEGDDDLLESYTYGTFAEYLWFMSPPGAMWNYSNPNFVLAGLVTQELDGDRAWPDIMVEDLYQPLGMDRTFLRKTEVAADGDYAESYGFKNLETGRLGKCDLDDVADPGWARPAGLAWSTPSQMLAYAEFLMDGDEDVLSAAAHAQLTEPVVDLGITADGTGYAMGLFVAPGLAISETEYIETPVWDHGGNTLWYTSAFYVLPEHDFAISILSNGYGDDWGGAVVAAITSLNEDLPEPVAVPALDFDPDGLDAHTGSYLDPYNVGETIVSREGDLLYVDFPLLDELKIPYERELYPAGTDVWYFNVQGTWTDLSFVEDEGETRWVRTRFFVADREAEVEETAALGVSPDPERLRALLARLPEHAVDPLLTPHAPR